MPFDLNCPDEMPEFAKEKSSRKLRQYIFQLIGIEENINGYSGTINPILHINVSTVMYGGEAKHNQTYKTDAP